MNLYFPLASCDLLSTFSLVPSLLYAIVTFRAETRNKHARVLTVRQASRQAPSLKKWRDFRQSSAGAKKVANFVCFLNISGKQQCFNLTNGKVVDCFMGNNFVLDKISLKTVSEPFIFSR